MANETIARTAALLLRDHLTFADLNARMPNPSRRWWQVWKPHTVPKVKFYVESGKPIKFKRPPSFRMSEDG